MKMYSCRVSLVVVAALAVTFLGLGAASAQSGPAADELSSGRAGEQPGEAGGSSRRRKSSSSEPDSKSSSRRTSSSRRRRSGDTRTTKRTTKKSTSTRKKRSREITVPVDIAAGPAFFAFGNPLVGDGLLSGPVVEDQTVHYGLRFNMAAIIDRDFVRKYPHTVPRKYRGMFKEDTVVRFKPAALGLIPRNLYLSPKTKNTGIYGATWELLHVGMALMQSGDSRLSVGAGLLATYAYIDSDAFESPTHFLRPGASVGLKFGTMLSDSFGVSAGANSNFYLPQDIGGGIFDGDGDDALWHIGEAFLMLHYRFPFTTEM